MDAVSRFMDEWLDKKAGKKKDGLYRIESPGKTRGGRERGTASRGKLIHFAFLLIHFAFLLHEL